MPAKMNRYALITITALLILVAALFVGYYFSKPEPVVSADNKAGMQSLVEKPAQAITPQTEDKEIVSETQNDITVEITSAKVISTGMEIGICYTTPDNGEWRPLPGHLFYGNYETYPDEIEFLAGEILADGTNIGRRCALIRYRSDDLSTLTAPMEFSILQFYAPGREMYTPCQELQQRLDSNPKAQAYGLKADCGETSDGHLSVMLLGHDPSVASEAASQLLDEIAKPEINGHWVFTLNEIER